MNEEVVVVEQKYRHVLDIPPERGATNRPGTQIECLECLSPRVQNVSEPPVD